MIISFKNQVNGVLTDATSVKLSDPTASFGVRRTDTNAVIVADNTSMNHDGTGLYSYSFDEPAAGLTYEYWVEFVYAGETYRIQKYSTGNPQSGTRNSPMRCSDYIAFIEHALGGAMDSRLDPVGVVNQALSFLFNMHDWKFRKRPSLDVTFQLATTPTVVAISSITRASNVVTVVAATAPSPGFSTDLNAPQMIVSGVTDASFNGTFTVVSVISSVSATWSQTAADATSSGGTVGAYPYEQYIDLPADFGELVAVCTKNNAIANIQHSSLPEIAWRRGSPNAIAYDGLWRCALSFPGQDNATSSQHLPRLEIWPRPTASNSLGDLTLTYRAGPIPVTLSPDTVPNIPLKFERLLCLLSRLFAQGYEEEKVEEDPIIQAEVAMLMESDGRQDLNVGMVKGGAVQLKKRYQLREFRTISDPANRRE